VSWLALPQVYAFSDNLLASNWLYTRYNRLSNRLDNRFDNRLYRVNRA